jgi:trigger factor
MVDAEYQNIMQQLQHEASHEEDPKAALAEIEGDADEYRTIAERRVRLGLLLSEIGNANGIEVSQTEMSRLVAQAAHHDQGKERDRIIEDLQQEPMAAAQLRAPLYEDKVVDFLFSKADITDRTVDRAEIEADLESEEGHVHGPDCGHDHGGTAKPAKKAKAKTGDKAAKAEAKQPVPTKAKAAPKKADIVEQDVAPKPAKPLKSEPANKGAAEAVKTKPAKTEAKKPAAKKAAKAK